jgi:hypothetical protein
MQFAVQPVKKASLTVFGFGQGGHPISGTDLRISVSTGPRQVHQTHAPEGTLHI